jgi:hypothetical protein
MYHEFVTQFLNRFVKSVEAQLNSLVDTRVGYSIRRNVGTCSQILAVCRR